MLASAGATTDGGNWIAEVKFDGFRVIATVAGGKLSLRSRPGSNATDVSPSWLTLPPGLEATDAVIDG